MATTVGKLATELGATVAQVEEACTRARVSIFGAQTPLDDAETARVRAALGVPPVAPPYGPPPGGFAGPGQLPPPPTPPVAPRPSGGAVPIWAVMLIGALVVVAVLLGAVAVTGGDDAPEADGPGARPFEAVDDVLGDDPASPPTSAPRVFATDLAVGDCWNDAGGLPLLEVTDELAGSVEVPCTDPHQAEVYAIVDHPARPDEPFPGDDAVARWADEQCFIRFEAFVGLPYADSVRDIMFHYPSPRSWLLGDRQSICSVFPVDDSRPTGTLAGSRR